jgi:acetyl-CoA C-acetyltransferase
VSRAFIVGARRTAVAPQNGVFAALPVEDLARPVIQHLMTDLGLNAARIDELIVSNALGGGGNPARVIGLAAALPETVGGLTIDRQCAGGLDALLLADALIRTGRHDIVIAGGAESYSRRPLRLRTFADGREPEPFEQAQFTPWPERDPDMAEAANRLALDLGINKAEQDAWAIESHRKAIAKTSLRNSDEIVEVTGVTTDTFTRALSSRHCAKARSICGGITAANMAVAADAAAFVIMVSEKVAAELASPAVEICAGATIGGDPENPGLAPVAAINHVLKAIKTSAEHITSAEIMEAFAVQAIACQQGAGLNPTIVNKNGGALARGHPIGASGTILAVSMFHDLIQHGGTGLAAIAAAGGLGTALVARRS